MIHSVTSIYWLALHQFYTPPSQLWLFPSVWKKRLEVDWQRSCSLRVSGSLEGACFYQGWNTLPVHHPDRADNHSAKPEEFLPTIKGLFIEGIQLWPVIRVGRSQLSAGQGILWYLPCCFLFFIFSKFVVTSIALVKSTCSALPPPILTLSVCLTFSLCKGQIVF